MQVGEWEYQKDTEAKRVNRVAPEGQSVAVTHRLLTKAAKDAA